MLKVKLVLAALVSIMPFNALRLFGYRLLGYLVSGRIGFGTLIAVSSVNIKNARISAFNLFVGPMAVVIGEGASIGSFNIFACGFWTTQAKYDSKKYARRLTIGANTLVTTGHYFDVAGAFMLGEGSWIAGMGSQFWTHGAGVLDRDIQIGRNCYVGSAARFAPGSKIGDTVLVALGSVVTGEVEASKAMIGGVPAEILKTDFDWRDQK